MGEASMNTSILATIYDQLEAMTVTYLDKSNVSKTATVYSQETMLDSIQTAHLPARVLLPPSGSLTINPGGNNLAQWKISDIFFQETAAQGGGVDEEIPSMTRYIIAYSAAIGKLWQIAYQTSTETRTLLAQITSGKFEYPSQSGVWFFGVRCDLTIEELF
jgi:hypothetical protein